MLEQMRRAPQLLPVAGAGGAASLYAACRTARRSRSAAHDWRVITGFGHSPEHASLYCAELNVLISGDMVLPRISTNVSRVRRRAGSQSAAAVPRFAATDSPTCRTTRWCCPRMASRSAACTPASASCASTTRRAWPRCCRPARAPQSATDIVPIMFRRRSTPTSSPLRWANSRTCTNYG